MLKPNTKWECCTFGEGVAKNPHIAVQWYRKAADQGYADAQTYLGYSYEHGEGVARNFAEAAHWYREAADQGHADAQTYLGYLYEQGNGVARNFFEAVRWWRKAADQGHADAQRALAELGLKWSVSGRRRSKAPINVPNTHTHAAVQKPVAAASAVPQDLPPPSIAPRRALVIGNAAYGDQSLRNPVNDATDLASLLERLDFKVTLLTDADQEKMERAVRDFTTNVPNGTIGFFFFSGHGMQKISWGASGLGAGPDE